MNHYTAKTIFSGYKIGLGNPNNYVMVPEKKLDHTCMVRHGGLYMVIKKGTRPVKRHFQEGKRNDTGVKVFPDFYGCYFEWKPYQRKDKTEELSVLNNIVSSLPLDRIRELKEIAIGIRKP